MMTRFTTPLTPPTPTLKKRKARNGLWAPARNELQLGIIKVRRKFSKNMLARSGGTLHPVVSTSGALRYPRLETEPTANRALIE